MALLSLFITAFLAGSFVPLGSEVHLAYLYREGHNFWALLSIASLGNTLGGMSCYFMALYGGRAMVHRFLKTTEQKIDLWKMRLDQRSEWGALLCWLPFVGEVIATSLGFLSRRWHVSFY